ncbi:MAG: sulfate adenylyltransferase subunit CysD [Burkholderiaceae bacterium]|nr:sulfate adenylyltransferase subunit CysD [Burkholderiaceae bacterium]
MPEAPHLPLQQLNARRQRAVELRLAGQTLEQIRRQTGLSIPTVIGAYNAFLNKGWSGIATPARGRRVGQGRGLTPEEEAEVQRFMRAARPEEAGIATGLWTADAVREFTQSAFGHAPQGRALTRVLARAGIDLQPMAELARGHAALAQWREARLPRLARDARRRGASLAWCGQISLPGPSPRLLVAQTLRDSAAWLPVADAYSVGTYADFLERLLATWPGAHHILLHGIDFRAAGLDGWLQQHPEITVSACPAGPTPRRRRTSASAAGGAAPLSKASIHRSASADSLPMKLTHLQQLEAESIHIMREVVAEADNPVMLYSIGKDSATMLHLARKAFYPSPPPFPLLHVDTTWKFRDMYALRERMAAESGMKLLVHQNPEAAALGINPFDHGSQIHTDMWKTQGLKQALDQYGFDVAFGGARRDEEKSRAKERIFSFRSNQHRWDAKNQRPELWHLYNARKHKGESIRVFPLSNWTELDVWQYIEAENIPIVPLYFAAERPVVERDGALIMVDDERMPLNAGEVPVMRKVRFRTLGCYPLTGAIESEADTLAAIIQEMLHSRSSERQGRMIDHDAAASMEKKKQEGYF